MSVDRIIAIVTLSLVVSGAAFAGYHYRDIHLPEFETLKASVTYQECIQRCMDTCKANGVPLDRCNCGHCHVYRPSG